METLGGTCCSSSFILGTRLTGLPLLVELLLLQVVTGGRRPTVTKGGADNIEVSEGDEAAREDIFGLSTDLGPAVE